LAFVAAVGLFVGSSNVTVTVSPSVNPDASPPVVPSGSSASSVSMFGPALVPKLPVSNDDESVEDNEELVASCRLPLSFTVNRNSPSQRHLYY